MFTRPDKKDTLFISIIVLVHIVFFILALGYTRIYMGDSFEYIYEALNIKQHFFFYSGNPALPIEPEYMTQRQPGYPLFLLSVYLFTVNNWVVLILQNLLSIFNIYYIRSSIQRLGYHKQYDWLLLLLLIAYPAQFINANTIAPDILLQTCCVLYFGFFIQLFRSRQSRYALFMSMALIAGLMVKPVLYPFAFVHLVIIAAFYYRQYSRQVVLVALLPVVAVLCYNYSNYSRTGKFHFSSNQAFNAVFYYYGYFSRTQGADSARHFLQNERASLAAIPIYKDRYNFANDRGTQLLKQNFFPYMAYHLTNSARIFIEPGKAEMDLFTGRLTYGGLYSGRDAGFYALLRKYGISGIGEYVKRNPSMPFVLLVLLFNIVRLAGLVLFFFHRGVPLRLRLFIFMFMAYFAVAAGPIANTRYFLPVSLIAIVCGTLGISRVIEKRRSVRS